MFNSYPHLNNYSMLVRDEGLTTKIDHELSEGSDPTAALVRVEVGKKCGRK